MIHFINLYGCTISSSTVDVLLCPQGPCVRRLLSVARFVCVTAMISDLHLFYGMAGMRIVSRLEKRCASN